MARKAWGKSFQVLLRSDEDPNRECSPHETKVIAISSQIVSGRPHAGGDPVYSVEGGDGRLVVIVACEFC
jgi:hypothetical protein